MAVAFVTSFLVTVTAFAADTYAGANTYAGFDFYVGRYDKQHGMGHISVSTDYYFSLAIYRDDNYNCYVGGNHGAGRIVSGPYGFDAEFPSVVKCAADGFLPPNESDRGTIPNYRARGTVYKKDLSHGVIEPHQSSDVFVQV